MKHPRYVVTDEEGDMAIASELVDLGLTWKEAEKAVKSMKGSEDLKEIADGVIQRRKKTETPPRLA